MTDILDLDGPLADCPSWCEFHEVDHLGVQHIGMVGGLDDVEVGVVQRASSCGALAGKRYVSVEVPKDWGRYRVLLPTVDAWQLAGILESLKLDPLAMFIREATGLFTEES